MYSISYWKWGIFQCHVNSFMVDFPAAIVMLGTDSWGVTHRSKSLTTSRISVEARRPLTETSLRCAPPGSSRVEQLKMWPTEKSQNPWVFSASMVHFNGVKQGNLPGFCRYVWGIWCHSYVRRKQRDTSSKTNLNHPFSLEIITTNPKTSTLLGCFEGLSKLWVHGLLITYNLLVYMG